jgi:hypothetical protein
VNDNNELRVLSQPNCLGDESGSGACLQLPTTGKTLDVANFDKYVHRILAARSAAPGQAQTVSADRKSFERALEKLIP